MLICTDMDRTLLPNGRQPESPEARPAFARVAARPEVTLAYVTGRHLQLALEAVHHYALPEPDYFATDVGSMIYRRVNGEWQAWDAWQQDIAPAWNGLESGDLKPLFANFSELSDQPDECQNRFKLSYFVDHGAAIPRLLETMRLRLAPEGIDAELIYSHDETTNTHLLDVLPTGASKLHAVLFLRDSLGLATENVLFAGDSGNDLDALTGPAPAVLVANASESVRSEASMLAARRGTQNRLYFARGGLAGMNGNYAAGILEGLVHFHPAAKLWL